MDPATIGLIAAGLKAAIEAYARLEQAKGGLTEDERAAQKQLRKNMVELARELVGDLDQNEG